MNRRTNLIGRLVEITGAPVPVSSRDVFGDRWAPPIFERHIGTTCEIVSVQNDGHTVSLLLHDGTVVSVNLTTVGAFVRVTDRVRVLGGGSRTP